MTTLYIILASDLFFAIAIWFLIRDHRKKIDAIYEKWDKKHERTKNVHLKLDK